jgi:HSP20 family protein
VDSLDQLFDRVFQDRLDPDWRGLGNNWVPAVDVVETENEYFFKAEMPGMKKDDVKISILDNVLTLTGEKKTVEEKTDKEKKYHRVERSYGTFQRSFALSSPIKADKISATYKDGILEIQVPKTEEAKPKEIDIQVR